MSIEAIKILNDSGIINFSVNVLKPQRIFGDKPVPQNVSDAYDSATSAMNQYVALLFESSFSDILNK